MRLSFYQVDSALPGFLYDYVRGILRKADCHDKFDISETVLRLGGAPESEGDFLFQFSHEKTNSLGFRPGLTQTGLYSHRGRLEP